MEMELVWNMSNIVQRHYDKYLVLNFSEKWMNKEHNGSEKVVNTMIWHIIVFTTFSEPLVYLFFIHHFSLKFNTKYLS